LRCGIGEGDRLVLGAIGRMTGKHALRRPFCSASQNQEAKDERWCWGDENENAGNELAAYPTLLIV